jgi:hypothetical protein
MKKPPVVVIKKSRKQYLKLDNGQKVEITPCPTLYANGFKPEATAKPHPNRNRGDAYQNSWRLT